MEQMEQKEGAMGVGREGRRKLLRGFVANATRNKTAFTQLFLMTGVLFLSMRSLGQKYRIRDLQEDISNLESENSSLSLRMNSIRSSLQHEASLHPNTPLDQTIHTLF